MLVAVEVVDAAAVTAYNTYGFTGANNNKYIDVRFLSITNPEFSERTWK